MDERPGSSPPVHLQIHVSDRKTVPGSHIDEWNLPIECVIEVFGRGDSRLRFILAGIPLLIALKHYIIRLFEDCPRQGRNDQCIFWKVHGRKAVLVIESY